MLEGFPITNVIDQDDAILGTGTDWIKPSYMGTLTQQCVCLREQNSAAYSATVVPFSANSVFGSKQLQLLSQRVK